MTEQHPGEPEGQQFETDTQRHPAPSVDGRPLSAAASLDASALDVLAQRVLWLATAIIDAANRGRPNEDGVKVGGHQSSSASMVGIMTALWFTQLTREDRVSVKPHASPVLHAINHLLGELDPSWLSSLRRMGGLQAYPSRTKDPDRVDFSTGSVGIGATAPLWAALAHRYLSDHQDVPPAGRWYSLLGDAEMDEGAVWEAIIDPEVRQLGEVVWIVDLNRQSLDRVIPDVQIARLQGMFAAADWQVLSCPWGSRLQALFAREGGGALEERLRQMPNPEYQRLLRSRPEEIAERLLGPSPDPAMAGLIRSLDDHELAVAIRDLGGHDIGELMRTFGRIDDDRPTVIFAYTIKGRGLATEGHPGNHAAQLTGEQMAELATMSGTSLDDPWAALPADSEAARLCAETAERLRRDPIETMATAPVPVELGWKHKALTSTQAALGRVLSDLRRGAPEVAERVVTVSPDVASSTNLGGWINKTGVWSAAQRPDWFADAADRLLRWEESRAGQHLELGIAEVNLVSLLGELGATWSRWGRPLIPIGTIYDPFVSRALEPWTFGIYAGGQSILIGTPSGVTLAPEGGAHQSISTPSIGISTPGVDYWEPGFAQDLEWTLLAAMAGVGHAEGRSAYLRLSTLPVNQSLAELPEDAELRERRREQVVEGGYRIAPHPVGADEVTVVGVGAMMPQVLRAAADLRAEGIRAGVVCLTSPSRLFASVRARQGEPTGSPRLIDRLLPAHSEAAIVTVQDGHPHGLAFLGGATRGPARHLGTTAYGQSSSVADAHRWHGIDDVAIRQAARDLIGR